MANKPIQIQTTLTTDNQPINLISTYSKAVWLERHRKEVKISFKEHSSYLPVKGHYIQWQKTLSRDNEELSETGKTVKYSTTEINWSEARCRNEQTVLGQRRSVCNLPTLATKLGNLQRRVAIRYPNHIPLNRCNF